MTTPYAEVIGDPIAHSKSPLIHNFWLTKLGMPGEYRAERVEPDRLESYLSNRRNDPAWRGCNITIPHKESAYRLITQAGLGALGAGGGDFGAINTIEHGSNGTLVGWNTDIEGVVGPFNQYLTERYNDQSPPPLHIAIVGAGGAARAALWGLRYHPSRDRFTILVRREAQGQMLLDAMGVEGSIKPITDASLEGVDVLINASPLGMVGKPALELSPVAMNRKHGLIFDMVYAPLETELIRQAEAFGINCIDGLQMLVGQASGAFQHFFGEPVPRELIREIHKKLREA